MRQALPMLLVRPGIVPGRDRRATPPFRAPERRSVTHNAGVTTAGHLGSFARFLARRDRRERADAAALADLAKTPLPLPPGLDLEWLGTAGYRLTHEGQTLLHRPLPDPDPAARRAAARAGAAGPGAASSAPPRRDRARSPGSSSGTPTSTTPSTSPPSPGRSARPRTARTRWHS